MKAKSVLVPQAAMWKNYWTIDFLV